MEAQREEIARAAYECLVEKGLSDTSLRDVCVRAGVSHGALYVHFSSKEELVAEARKYDERAFDLNPVPETWGEFAAAIEERFGPTRKLESRRRARLSWQITAEAAVSEKAAEGLPEASARRIATFKKALECLHANKEIDLPLGADLSASLVANLVAGSIHMAICHGTVASRAWFTEMLDGIAFIAGRKNAQSKSR
jgi:AcrR family transcriptional regulator